MKHIIKTVVFAAFAFLFTSTITAQEKFKLPEYTQFKLKNGLTVYLMEQHEVPLIQLTGVFPGGAIFDEESKSGLANITAEALALGSKNYTKAQIEENVEFLGATMSTGASLEYAYLSSSFMKKDQKEILTILKDVLLNPTFPKEELDKLLSRRLVEMDQSKESPRAVLGSYYNKFVFGNHPYGNPEEGIKSTLETITKEDITSFYKDMYVPSTSAIAVVGDFDTKSMKREIESLFGKWKSEDVIALSLPVAPVPNEPRVLVVNKEDATETTFYIGGPGISRNNPDYVGLEVINTILGGRFTSWLNDELRVNSGLTYGASSWFSHYKLGGSFIMATFTANETTEQTIDLALTTYKKLHEKGLDQEILLSAKNYVKGQFPPNYETNRALAGLLTDMFTYNFDEAYINTFSDQVDALTVEKAGQLIETYFPKDNLQFVLIGKASEIVEMAKKYGTVKQVEITADGF
ncbi:pitrilysin family protein [Cellulophaga sp. L1A9]|uniref:M16 family metallopeptidase n=1 Tax=Cellulophaga sp. L1A9 TaxID=2686362 RepID=UPI00131E81EE|nr:pitrilysin family protein [Cellulophaga sp. L1A9]